METRHYFVISLLIDASILGCLASPCKQATTYGTFKRHDGSALTGQVIDSKEAPSLTICASLCLASGNCTSANFGTSERICELNGINGTGEVQPRQDWTYLILVEEPRKCPYGWEAFEDSCYRFFDSSLDFDASETFCNNFQGHIVHVGSQGESDFLIGWIRIAQPAIQKLRIGYSDEVTEGDWVWSDGVTGTFTNWDGSQPDDVNGQQDCAVMWKIRSSGADAGTWDDQGCGAFMSHFICELDLCP